MKPECWTLFDEDNGDDKEAAAGEEAKRVAADETCFIAEIAERDVNAVVDTTGRSVWAALQREWEGGGGGSDPISSNINWFD